MSEKDVTQFSEKYKDLYRGSTGLVFTKISNF